MQYGININETSPQQKSLIVRDIEILMENWGYDPKRDVNNKKFTEAANKFGKPFTTEFQQIVNGPYSNYSTVNQLSDSIKLANTVQNNAKNNGFTRVLDGLFGYANQAADVVNKFKGSTINSGQSSINTQQIQPPLVEQKSNNTNIILIVIALVVVVGSVLLLKKKGK